MSIFLHCLRISALPTPVSGPEDLRDAVVVVARCSDSQERYGILTPDEVVIMQTIPEDLESEQNDIIAVPLQECSITSRCDIDAGYNIASILERATNTVGSHGEGAFSPFGDDFVHWCVTGEYLAPDSDIFGEQYSRPFPLAIVLQADHHAIGIDGQHVMQFSDPEKRGQNKINWTTFEDFLKGQPPTHLPYPELSDDRHRLEARNRALKAFLYSEKFGTYGLFSNNCEHFAHWCKTGESGIFTSDQVKELALNTAKAGAAAVMTGTLHRPPPPGIIKNVSDYIRKHVRSPGSYFK